MPLTAASCRRIAITAAVVLHACALIGALTLRPAAAPEIVLPPPIAVQWIEPPRIEPPKPIPVAPPPPPKRKPVPKPPKPKVVRPQPAPVIAAAEAPPVPEAPVVAPPPPAPPAPVAVPTPPAPPAPAPATAPAPPPIVEPRFDAAYLKNPPPPYPAQSRRLGETGRVVLRVLVTAGGTPERVELRTSSGSRRLDGAALKTVQRWKFIPARQGDTPVSAWVLIPILFTLEG
ncbi:MAG: TonB family protein [Betaproteobacteria bacterium]|nr:TonB family protein [Betaproteobacteria bacterium]